MVSQDLNFNPGTKNDNWDVYQNNSGYTIDSRGNTTDALDVNPTAYFGVVGF